MARMSVPKFVYEVAYGFEFASSMHGDVPQIGWQSFRTCDLTLSLVLEHIGAPIIFPQKFVLRRRK